MNYYNPYYMMPTYNMMPALTSSATRPGLFSRLLGGASGIKWSSILNGTQKTLNILNQGIPLVRQASPLMKNAKTMFRLMNEFKKVDTPTTASVGSVSNDVVSNIKPDPLEPVVSNVTSSANEGPTFFI